MPNVSNETPKSSNSEPLARAVNEAEEAVYDWLTGLGSQGSMDVALKRTFPPEHKGVMTKGILGHYDEPITEESIKSAHGGGRYQVVVKTMGNSGKWKYAGSRTFEIAGEPKVSSLRSDSGSDDDTVAAPVNGGNNNLGQQAMNAMLRLTTEAQERAKTAGERSGTDWEMIERLVSPMRDELAALRSRNDDKDKQILELLGKPPDNSSQDRLFGIMESKESTHGNAIQAMRVQHDSELRALREFNREEIRRREDRFEKEIEHVRAAATGQIDSLKMAHTQAIDSQRHGFEMRIDGLKDIQGRLERELEAHKGELVALRAKKEQGPLDQIQNLVTLKNGFDALVPSAAEPVSAWARAAEVAGPLVEGIAARFAGGGGGGPSHEEIAHHQAMLQGAEEENEMVSVRRGDGKIIQVPKSTLDQMRRAREQQAAANEEKGLPPDMPPLADEDVARAVTFIEAAIRNNTDPEVFARSARNMIPDNILQYVKRLGVDRFLNDVAKLENSSPLATVAGRMYVRKVAKFLLEGTTEGIEVEPVVEPQPSPEESS